MEINYLELLKTQASNSIRLLDKRPGVTQLLVPLYHEDGDGIDIFLESNENGNIRVCDHGATLMRLSYDINVNAKHNLTLKEILSQNQVHEEKGNIYIDTTPEKLYVTILKFAQTVAKVSTLRFL